MVVRVASAAACTGKAILTKSAYMATRHCPTKLFYLMNPSTFTNAQTSDTFLHDLAAAGHLVGKLGRLHYRSRRRQGLDGGIGSTLRFEVEASCAAFQHLPRLHCRVDIVLTAPNVNGGTSHKLIEVKRKVYDSRLTASEQLLGKRGDKLASAFEPLVHDVAFQKHVYVQSLGATLKPLDTVECYLLLPDRSKVSPPDLSPYRLLHSIVEVDDDDDLDSSTATSKPSNPPLLPSLDLLTLVDVSSHVDALLPSLLSLSSPLSVLGRHLPNYGESPDLSLRHPPSITSLCASCQFRSDSSPSSSGVHQCFTSASSLPSSLITSRQTVLDLHGFRGKDRLLASGVYKLEDVKPEHLKSKSAKKSTPLLYDELTSERRMQLQISGSSSLICPTYLRTMMSSWKYPLHLIDFETSLPVLPYFPSTSPSSFVAFQFSHHTLSAEGVVSHKGSFLSVRPDSGSPNVAFLRELRRQLEGDDGTVMMWSAHERTVLRAIGRQDLADERLEGKRGEFESLKSFFDDLTEQGGKRTMVDLKDVAVKGYWCRESQGSSSLKRLLPPTITRSPFLRDKYGLKNILELKNSPLKYEDLLCLVAGGDRVPPSTPPQSSSFEFVDDEESAIADGGAAATAYAHIQSGCAPLAVVERMEAELLRYCELDTLAMAMILEAWRAELGMEVEATRT